MPGLVAWKLVIPIAAVAAIAILVARSGDFPNGLEPPPAKSRPATLGYLTSQELPDGVALLPPPPQPGSLAMKSDEQARAAAVRLRGKPRSARSERRFFMIFSQRSGSMSVPRATPQSFTSIGRGRS
jgi:acid phosphatase (class A)